MSLEELEEKRRKLEKYSCDRMQEIIDESYRCASVASNCKEILEDLDKEFETKTGLKGYDVKFLFVAIGLQMTKTIIINELSKIENAGSKNRNETKLHELQNKILSKYSDGENVIERPYYASLEHIITKMGVPYDATRYLNEKSYSKLLDKGKEWSFDIDDMVLTEKTALFKGANHRFTTLGHDPILGLIFGTANIMTNTITCVKKSVDIESISLPMLTTNHVVHSMDFKDPHIGTYGSTIIMLQQAVERIEKEPNAFVSAFIKQIIHIGTDLYTPCGIQIPGANLILSNSNVEKLTKNVISTGDIVKVGMSAGISVLINQIISSLHTLMYDSSMEISRELYEARTRKIIMYSNSIATGSNVLWVGGNMIYGNQGAIKQLDFGGLLVTINRLITDTEYIRKIKEEFVFGEFNKMIQG